MDASLRGLALLAVVAMATPAAAHEVGLSRGLYTLGDGGVDVELVFARKEAATAVPGLDADTDGVVDTAEVSAAAAQLTGGIVGNIRVHVGSVACAGALQSAGLTEEDGLVVRAHYACAEEGTTTVDVALADRLSAGHRHLAQVITRSGELDFVVRAGNTAFSFDPSASDQTPPPSRLAYVGIGVEHILLGFDHLVFLFGLILVGGRLRSLVAVVTAFTVAHSMTLGLAVLGIFAPSAAIIEPLIAFSIAYVGVENFFVTSAAGRWRVAALFGLIHGFGFAGALADVGVPRGDVPLTLLLFNLGVEVGQLMVLAVLVPVLELLRRRQLWTDRVTRVASVGVILLGLFWFVERLLGVLGILP